MSIATTKLNGHSIHTMNGSEWFYTDTGEPTATSPKRTCRKCGCKETPKGHDWCIADLDNVQNACCGHGVVGDAYVQLNNGLIIRGARADQYFKRIEKQNN
jgi:hypothetical protein